MALREFITKIKTANVARPNKYEVSIFPPAGLGAAPRDLAMMAESVSFPGQNVRASADLLRHGPQREVGQGMTYGPFNITFICTEGLPEKKFFEEWQEFIINKETWEARFYKDYVGTINLSALTVGEQESYSVKIHEAYPKTITAQEFGYGNSGAYQTISVEITYRHWDSEVKTPTSISPSILSPSTTSIPWANPNGNPSPEIPTRAPDRHPPVIDEFGVNTTPAVPNPADQQFLPSPGQPVAQSPTEPAGPGGRNSGVGDGRP